MTTADQDGPASPVSSRTPCPRCEARETVLGTLTERFVYLRCPACFDVWAIPERRRHRRQLAAAMPRAGSDVGSQSTD